MTSAVMAKVSARRSSAGLMVVGTRVRLGGQRVVLAAMGDHLQHCLATRPMLWSLDQEEAILKTH